MAQLGAAKAAMGTSSVLRVRRYRVMGLSTSRLSLWERLVNGVRGYNRIPSTVLAIATVLASGPTAHKMAHAQVIENHNIPDNTPGLECRYTMAANPTVYAGPSTTSRILGYISKGVLAQDGPVINGWVPTVTANGTHGWVLEYMTFLKGRAGFPHRCHVVRGIGGKLTYYLGVY